jgi:hypothetical protein
VWVAGTEVNVSALWIFTDLAVFFNGSIALVEGEDACKYKKHNDIHNMDR